MLAGSNRTRILLRACLSILAIALLTGHLPPALAGEGPRAPAASSAIVTVYRNACLQCHDNDGRGEIARDVFRTIPDFADPTWQASRGDAELRLSILQGKGKSMPAMKSKLGAVDVDRMVAFVRGFRGGRQVVEDEDSAAPAAAPASAAREPAAAPRQVDEHHQGRMLYQRMCATCHGRDGKGASMRATLPTLPDFTHAPWHAARSDPRLVVSVLRGKGTGMPPFQHKLAREQVRDVVAFLRAFAPGSVRDTRSAPTDFEVRFRQLEEEFQNLRRQSARLTSTQR